MARRSTGSEVLRLSGAPERRCVGLVLFLASPVFCSHMSARWLVSSLVVVVFEALRLVGDNDEDEVLCPSCRCSAEARTWV